jgi:hypothetical protein
VRHLIEYTDEGEPINWSTSWPDCEEGREAAEDTARDLNFAYGHGRDSVFQLMERHQKWLRDRAEWLRHEYLHGGNFEHLKAREDECLHIANKLKELLLSSNAGATQ